VSHGLKLCIIVSATCNSCAFCSVSIETVGAHVNYGSLMKSLSL